MAASLKMFYWKSGNSTAASAGVELSSASCLVFGSGNRDSYAANITINTYNTTMHHAYTTAEGATEVCGSPHMWGFTYIAATGCSIGGNQYIPMDIGTPHAARGLGFRFTYDNAVRVNPIQIWNGAGDTSNLSPQNCIFQICDLTSAHPTWKAASVTGGDASKLALKVHGVAATEHWWSVGMSLMPTVVGHSGQNKVRVELTYY